MDSETLITPRLILRQPQITDSAALCAQFSDFEVAKMTASVAHPYPLHAAEMWLLCYPSARRRGLRHSFAIQHDGKMIGIISLFRADSQAQWELGYHIARDVWGRGFATEAARAVLDYAYDSLCAAQVGAGIYTDNPASHRVIIKLGFERGAAERVWCMARGKYVEGHTYSIDLRNWPKRHEALKDAS